MALRQPPPGDEAPEERLLGELYRASSTEKPPSRLDAAVRAAARSGGARSASRSSWWVPWRIPFAVAAVALVSGSLALLVQEERPETLREAPAAPAAPEPPVAVAPTPETSSDTLAAAGAPAAKRTLERDETVSRAQTQSSRRIDPEKRAPVGPVPPLADARPAMRQDAAPPPAPAPAPMASAPAAAPAPANTELFKKEGRAGVSGTIGIRGLNREDLAVGQAAQDAAAPRSGEAPSAAATSKAAAPPAERRARSEARDGPDITALKAELEREPPQRWVERIDALRRAGRTAEADALSTEFRRRFPDEPLPAR